MGDLMFQVRIHGRGGQGVVSAAEMLSLAAFDEKRYAQAFPSFGSERTGAPVVSYVRMAAVPIRNREPVLTPDAVIVQDPTLLHLPDVFAGLPDAGYLLINTNRSVGELDIDRLTDHLHPDRVVTVPATDFARELLGRPLPNAALLGGFAALTGEVSLTSVEKAIRSKFAGTVADGNVAAACAAFHHVVATSRAGSHVAAD
jgi:pyruvate ferredoxin oxidoreductase gamma subunit